jgi:hypothetical protein
MGSLAAGGAATIGTGAFTNVSANRDMEIGITGDASSLLSITPAEKPNGDLHANADDYVVIEADGTVSLDFTGSENGGSGLNKDATTIIDALLDFTNQGTQPINIGEVSQGGRPGSFYAEGDLTDGDGDSFDVDDFPENGDNLNISGDIGPGETLQNIGFVVTDPETVFNGNGSQTFTVTFEATRVGGDRV